MAPIPTEPQKLFKRKSFAHLATLMPDGSPQVTPVWIDYDQADGRILVNTERGRRKEKNVRRDARVALSVTYPDDPYDMWAVRGRVDELTTIGAREHIDELSERYLDHPYTNPIKTERVIMAIQPERVSHRPS